MRSKEEEMLGRRPGDGLIEIKDGKGRSFEKILLIYFYLFLVFAVAIGF